MPSLIHGYEYDIFISYRHKDNRYDGWVSEFVANLGKELAATFKEDVSIYFDENPNDGILDTHVVDKTIGNKIKCLVFIPILSQTYCDPASFAWNNEFLAFRNFAAADGYTADIRLKNGNVASRIVPVRIHDLDEHDRELVEVVTGAQLRSVDFVYRAPGVNRPLRAVEDRPKENLNNIYYRDQINKVANIIKDIIRSMRSAGNETKLPPAQSSTPSRLPGWTTGPAFRIAVGLAAAFMLGYVFFFHDTPYAADTAGGKTTIAVIPFRVTGNAEATQYFADGIMESILSSLSSLPDLKVKSRTSVEKYRGTSLAIPAIAGELDVHYILEGSLQKAGDNIRVLIQLVDGRNDINVWSQRFDGRAENIFEIQNRMLETIAEALKTTLTPDLRHRISRNPTDDFEAYDLYLRARQMGKKYGDSHNPRDLNAAIKLLELSLEHDARFGLAYGWLAAFKTMRYNDLREDAGLKDSIVFLAGKALQIDSSLVEPTLVLSELFSRENNDVNALRYTWKALRHPLLDSAVTRDLLNRIGTLYSRVGYTERALELFEMVRRYDTSSAQALHSKFYALAAEHRVDDLLALAAELNRHFPGDPYASLAMIHLWVEEENFRELVDFYPVAKEQFAGDPYGLEQYGLIYAWALAHDGQGAEARALEQQFEETFGDDDFYKAQLHFFRREHAQGLALLKGQEVGWYNVNLLDINPILGDLEDHPELRKFIDRNREILLNKKERIRELEDQGFLPPAADYRVRTHLREGGS